MEKRCSGHCCKDFPLPVSIDDLKDPNRTIEDSEKIADMLILLRESEYADGRKQYRYTCKHLTSGGDCTIHNEKPKMCRDYPYGKPCEHKDCTADQDELIQLTKRD